MYIFFENVAVCETMSKNMLVSAGHRWQYNEEHKRWSPDLDEFYMRPALLMIYFNSLLLFLINPIMNTIAL